MNPVKGQIFQKFGAKWFAPYDGYSVGGRTFKKGDDIYKLAFNLDGHNGNDYVASLGEPIYAIRSGWIIEQTAKETGFGLRISHRFQIGDKHYMAVYGHMQRLERDFDIQYNWNQKDYWVKEGQVIGYVNSTGFSSGNHLHMSVYACGEKYGEYLFPNNGYFGSVDPEPILRTKMSNAKLIQVGEALGYWFPVTTPDGLKSQALNVGDVLPEKADGSVDFSKVVPDYKI